MQIRKVGGIHFARFGRVRVSFCLARRAPESELAREMRRADRRERAVVGVAAIFGTIVLYFALAMLPAARATESITRSARIVPFRSVETCERSELVTAGNY